MLGVTVTVIGLHGMKQHDKGRVRRCTKPRRWTGYLVLWTFGQALQLLAVKLAEEPVVAAVSNFAIVVNAMVSQRLLGETVTGVDLICFAGMIIGASLVVAFTPIPPQKSLSIAGVDNLFTSSPLPAIGLVSTTALAVLGLPRALLSAMRTSSRRSAAGGLCFGLLAGYCGATSITAAKLCWLIFDFYGWPALTKGLGWAISFVAFGGEIGMVVFLFNGMAWHEASVVVPTYYITMALFGSMQGLFVFHLLPHLTPLSASMFALGVLLCVTSIAWAAHHRQRHRMTESLRRSGSGHLLDQEYHERNRHTSAPSSPDAHHADAPDAEGGLDEHEHAVVVRDPSAPGQK
jgi:uncharacterized membrane protein